MYFMNNERQVQWDIRDCEEEIAEKSLVVISIVLAEWGSKHPFWTDKKE